LGCFRLLLVGGALVYLAVYLVAVAYGYRSTTGTGSGTGFVFPFLLGLPWSAPLMVLIVMTAGMGKTISTASIHAALWLPHALNLMLMLWPVWRRARVTPDREAHPPQSRNVGSG